MKAKLEDEIGATMWGNARPGKMSKERNKHLTIPIDDLNKQTLISWHTIQLGGQKPVAECAVLVLAHHGPAMCLPLTIVGVFRQRPGDLGNAASNSWEPHDF